MSSFASRISPIPLHPTKGIDQGVISVISQRRRYASFCYVQLVSEYDPLATVHIQHRSTSSTMIRYLTYFISIGRLLHVQTKTKTRITTNIIGGTNPHVFAEDGETSYLGQHPSWVFISFVHMARL